jgi:predicted Zn-dependent protease
VAATVILQRAIVQNSKNREFYRLLGKFSQVEGNIAIAPAMYMQVLALDPGDEQAQQALNQLDTNGPTP